MSSVRETTVAVPALSPAEHWVRTEGFRLEDLELVERLHSVFGIENGDLPGLLDAAADARDPEPEASIAVAEPEPGPKLVDQTAGDEVAAADSRLTAIPLTRVQMRSISWLERPLWQRSAFHLLAGVKGSGKGTYLAGLAARITNAGGNALFVSSEDSTEIDLKPRLVAAGAVIERCFTITQHLRLPGDVAHLEALAARLGGVDVLVIDPVANHIGAAKPNDDVEVRNAIAPLNALADRLDCLLIGVRHPGKDRSRGAVSSILGSTAWVDTPRAVVFIAVDDEDPAIRHIQVVAGNRSLNGRGQAFRIEAVDVPGLQEPITRAVELGESGKDVEQLLADDAEKNRRAAPKRDEAAEIILRELAIQPQPLDYLKAVCAAEAGIVGDTVYRAANALKADCRVRCSNSGPGTPWMWSLALTLASEDL